MKDYTNGPAPGFFVLWFAKGALLPVVLVTFVGFAAAFSYQSLKLGMAFDVEGIVTSATVTDRRTETVRRAGETETYYHVTFAYETADGPMEVERKVSRGVFRDMVPGASRDIRYLASRPRVMEHTVGHIWQGGQVMRWVSLGFGLAALGAFWWTARPAVEALRARKYGRAEWAKVYKIDERVSKSKETESRTHVLVWRDARGEMGESLPSSSRTRYFRYGPTSDIEVFRDSRGKTWWVGDVGPREAAATVPDVSKS